MKLRSLFLSLVATTWLPAQEASAPAAPPTAGSAEPAPLTALQSAEITYRDKAAEMRNPVLQAYLEELRKLLGNPRLEGWERDYVNKEIETVTKAIETKTMPNYSHLAPKQPEAESSGEPPPGEKGDLRRLFTAEEKAAFILRPGQTGPALSRFKDLSEFVGVQPAELGRQSWTIPDLAAGKYHVFLAYEMMAAPPPDSSLVFSLGDLSQPLKFEGRLDTPPGQKDFKRIGEFTVDAAKNNVAFTLSTSTADPVVRLFGVYVFEQRD
jgi:hypothetical protein